MATAAPPTQHLVRLLLLDDSRLDAQLVEVALEQAGLRADVTRAAGRAEFFAALEGPPFDVVLSDYNVPGFRGEEALTAALARSPVTPFIFVSGAIGEHTAIDLVQRGATDYVLKDRLDRLGPSVERALRERDQILERRRAEEALRERERVLSTLIGNLPGVAFRRRRELPWRLSFASDGCRELCGYLPEQLCEDAALGWDALIHPDDLPRVLAEIEAALRAGQQVTTTYRIRTAGGEERWVWERSSALPAVDGAASDDLEGFATDITQQKLAEQELRQRIEFEQQLLGIVSHDLRNPLTAITLGASLLVKREGLDEVSTASVRRILASAERAGRMIKDLLDFTQIRLGEGLPIVTREMELEPIVLQVMEELLHTHPTRRIAFENKAPDDAFGVWDPDRVAQALTNLVGNALTYSPPDTVVTVRVHADDEGARLEVHNLGEAIPPERVPLLFQPLSRGERAIGFQTRSIGLGLFIVDSIARAHGGAVSVSSTPVEGTTFTLALPRKAPGDTTS